MMEIFKTVGSELKTMDHIEDGVWINIVNPTEEEICLVCQDFKA